MWHISHVGDFPAFDIESINFNNNLCHFSNQTKIIKTQNMIDAIDIVNYEKGGRNCDTVRRLKPTLQTTKIAIKNMDPYFQPILWIFQNREIPDANCMAITGGDNIFHIQVVDNEGNWFEAHHESDDDTTEIKIWTSDQGFQTTKDKLWSMEKALEIVEYYYKYQEMLPSVKW
ncbi:MAG: hypothetical protein MRY83_05445 [Flavobacteriales bacterium]|nr:hypothetical protein [Flavobacteriales bacterium]